jgi:drug/metabolite transporter (DMT)-like permease
LAHDFPPAVLAGLLYIGAAVAIAPFAARIRLDRTAARRGAGRLALAVAAGGLVGPVAFIAGLSRTPAATASLLTNTELVGTAAIAAVFFREHLGLRLVRSVALVALAGVLLAWSGGPELRVGALLIVAACLCWALDNCVTAGLDTISPQHLTVLKGTVAGSTNVVVGLVFFSHHTLRATSIGGALLVGALGYGASITLWVSGARDIGAARGQLVFATAPFIGVAVAWIVFGDPIRAVEITALVLAAAGVAGVVHSDHEHEHHHDAVTHDHEHVHGDGHHEHDHDSAAAARHSHTHAHVPLTHSHPHVPDVFHRHVHDD